MDLQTIGSDLFKLSPLIGILAIAVYVLWGKLQKAYADIMDMMKAHADDRKEGQEKMSTIVSQNSVSNLQLSSSVDNLSKSVTDNTNRLISLESAVTKSNRASRVISTVKSAAA